VKEIEFEFTWDDEKNERMFSKLTGPDASARRPHDANKTT